MNKEILLKPCPFCACKQIKTVEHKYIGPVFYRVECDNCVIGTTLYADKRDAYKQWNKRVNDEKT